MANTGAWLTASHVLIFLGAVLGGVGVYGKYHFGKEVQRLEAREVFLNSLRFHALDGFWIETNTNTYELGLRATILNKDNTRAVVFEGVGYQGGFRLGGSGSATIQSIKLYDDPVAVHGDYFLAPGRQTSIHIRLPSEVRMIVQGGVPGLTLDGTWTFVFEDTPFSFNPPAMSMRDVVTLDEWLAWSAGT